ncbi:Uncharacterised protein [BD1-7 clade bacterium]|uniref:Lipocalin-like domain-containing protein n=1 Tax=BD1-7 clade bacterium TaxID=2029982 RepID=A0A5S9NQF3_9GAMM|nr:Uncharacterised protein [BD1-7 clade bacterium]
MFKYQTMVAILFVVITSGCDDLGVPNNEPNNEFIGVWELVCFEGISGTYTLSPEYYIEDYRVFESLDCTGTVVRDEVVETPIAYGEKITVDSGIEATEINYLVDVDGEEVHELGLIYRDGNQLYFSGDTSFDIRPIDINFDVYMTLQ